MRIDETGVDKMGSRRSGNKPFKMLPRVLENEYQQYEPFREKTGFLHMRKQRR